MFEQKNKSEKFKIDQYGTMISTLGICYNNTNEMILMNLFHHKNDSLDLNRQKRSTESSQSASSPKIQLIFQKLEKMRQEVVEPISPTLPDTPLRDEFIVDDERMSLEMENDIKLTELRTTEATTATKDLSNEEIEINNNEGISPMPPTPTDSTENPISEKITKKKTIASESTTVSSKNVALDKKVSTFTDDTMKRIKQKDKSMDSLSLLKESDDVELDSMFKCDEIVIMDAMDEEENEELEQLYNYNKDNENYTIRKRKQTQPVRIEKNRKMTTNGTYSYQSKMNPKHIEKKAFDNILNEILKENYDSKNLKFSNVSKDVLHQVAEEYLETTFDGIFKLIEMNDKITTLNLKYLYYYLRVQSNPNVHGKLSKESDEYMKMIK